MVSRAQCSLRYINEYDLPKVLTWRNSERIRQVMFSEHIISWEEHLAWYKKIKTSDEIQVLIFQYQGLSIGVVTLVNIDYKNRRCNWGFYIGDSSAPVGCGKAMGFLALEYAFEQLKLNKVCAEVLKSNIVSQKYHMRLGFTLEGCFEQHVYQNGNYLDVLCYAHFLTKWKETKDVLYQDIFRE